MYYSVWMYQDLAAVSHVHIVPILCQKVLGSIPRRGGLGPFFMELARFAHVCLG